MIDSQCTLGTTMSHARYVYDTLGTTICRKYYVDRPLKRQYVRGAETLYFKIKANKNIKIKHITYVYAQIDFSFYKV